MFVSLRLATVESEWHQNNRVREDLEIMYQEIIESPPFNKIIYPSAYHVFV